VDTESFTRLLQLSTSPVAIISGVGLLLLSITNRLGRVIDRARGLAKGLNEDQAHATPDRLQLLILFGRARLLRASIILAAASILACCAMIVFLFALNFVGRKMETLVLFTFGLSVLFVFGAMICFVADICSSLNALKVELSHHLRPLDKQSSTSSGTVINLADLSLRL
jgi:hypothetical protein